MPFGDDSTATRKRAYVDDRRQHGQALTGRDRRQSDLHRNLGAVLPQAEEVSPRPHGAHARIRQEILPLRGMRGAEALGDQHLDRFTEQLLARVSERRFDLPIDEDDASLGVGHQNTRGSGVDRRAQMKFEGARA